MREHHAAHPYRDREQMQEKREFDSLDHVVSSPDDAAPLPDCYGLAAAVERVRPRAQHAVPGARGFPVDL
jgi:hypothetical protein